MTDAPLSAQMTRPDQCTVECARTQPTILLVDDDALMLSLLSNLLLDKGELVCVANGGAALAHARELLPDLILLDFIMPDMDGLEVCRMLKRDPATAAIPVLILTAHDDDDLEVRALEAGAADFLCKPLKPTVVRARVQTQLELLRRTAIIRTHAQRDSLTNLFNRRYFDELALGEIARHQRQRLPLAVALVDVDHFKHYNDALGHQQGDHCLRQIASALSTRMRRPGEIVARYGGEEFAVLIPGCGSADTARYGEWIRGTIEELRISHPRSAVSEYVTISVGVVSLIPSGETSVPIILALADMGLYAAKKAGRNCHRALQG